ncbi:MAG: hypothetical protein ACOZNI_23665 [Myxococcota bacterium]
MRTLLLSFVVFVAVFAVTHVATFPGSVSYFREVTGGQDILDLRASSSAEETWQRLDAMGEAGRAAYRRLVLVVDVGFPLAAFVFLGSLARVAIARGGGRVLYALPVAYVALDLAENALVLALLDAFPARLDAAGAAIGWLTRGKRIAQAAALLVPIGVLIVAGRRRTAGPDAPGAAHPR